MNNSMAEIPGLADPAKLVVRLYEPGQPQEIKMIEKILQRLQRSPQGWQLADTLLQSNEQKVRFFGALTFTTKINRDWNTLSDDDAALLLDRLIHWLVRLVNAGEGALVIKKLCTSLVAYFLRPSITWKNCIRHLMVCLHQGDVIPRNHFSMLETSPGFVIESLSEPQLLAILWFAGGLAEEVKQANAASIRTHTYYGRASSEINDAVSLLQHCMIPPPTNDVKAFKRAKEGMICFQSWVMYAHRAWTETALELEALRQLTPLAIQGLCHENLFDEASELLIDILRSFPAILTNNNLEAIASILSAPEARNALVQLKAGNFDDQPMSFARLLLAYGEANVEELATKGEEPQRDQILRQILELTQCEGYPGVDDEICPYALDFWTTYVEFLTDSLFTVEAVPKPAWMENAQKRIVEAIELLWVKIRMPQSEIASHWDSNALAGFKSFRADLKDLLQTSYTLLGVEIFEKFAWLALQSLNDRAWLPLESTLFCLNALSDSVADEDSVDEILSTLFNSSLFADMTSVIESIPAKTRQSALGMITRFTTFFERHVELLPAMLNFLFGSVKAPALANAAAKAILSICSTCRRTLLPQLDNFLHQYEVLLTWDNVEALTKERVIGAIAAIVQDIPTDDQKYAPLSTLTRFIERNVEECLEFMNSSQAEEFEASGYCALRSLVGMGKALRPRDDVSIVLDEEDIPQSNFWSAGPGAELQSKIINIITTVTSLMRGNGDVIEAACQIFRTGYNEDTIGLFVFPPSVTVDFFKAAIAMDTARLEYVLDTGSAMLSRQSKSSDPDMQNAASTILDYNLKLIFKLNHDPSVDPEVASSAIDLAGKMVPHFLFSMMNLQSIQVFFDFTLASLRAAEIMPKRSASHFWAIFVLKYNLSENVAAFVNIVMKQYGPQLCHILVRNVGGKAARSELDALVEPLKKLVFARPEAKQWLSDALNSEDFPSQKVGPAEKRVWLQKVLSLRGARATNQVVKDFWIACRGSEFAYAS